VKKVTERDSIDQLLLDLLSAGYSVQKMGREEDVWMIVRRGEKPMKITVMGNNINVTEVGDNIQARRRWFRLPD
jgi:hypothetical protein